MVHGFENRFAKEPPRFDVPMLLITPIAGEGSPKNESFWLRASPQAKHITSCGEDPAEGLCAAKVSAFVESLDTSN